MDFHPVANIFPLMTGDEYRALVDDMRLHGQREAIWTYQGKVIDGRNRYNACCELGLIPRAREWDGDEAELVPFVVSMNLRRRHLDESQRAMVAGRLANIEHGGDRKSDQAAKLQFDSVSRATAATMLNVSERTVNTAVKVLREATPAVVAAVESGQLPVSVAAKMLAEPVEFQAAVVNHVGNGAKPADAIRETRRAAIVQQLEAVDAREAKAVQGVYDVIVIDPPWPMEKIERDVTPNQVAFNYPTMNEAEIRRLSIPCAQDCHVWLWTTHKFLPLALSLLESWQLKYVCTFTWHKPGGFQPYGLPQYNCEFAVYARRGAPQFVDTKAFNVCFAAPRGEHSEKPEAFYDVVRRVTAGRRLDMFARREIAGFEAWGKEAPHG